MELETKFIVSDIVDDSPPRIDEMVDGVEILEKINLREVPLNSIIQFSGQHKDSRYITQLIGDNNERYLKVWFKGNRHAAIAPIDEIVSFGRPFSPQNIQKGIMQIGMNYFLPHFYYNHNSPRPLIIDPMLRTEPYTELFLKRA